MTIPIKRAKELASQARAMPPRPPAPIREKLPATREALYETIRSSKTAGEIVARRWMVEKFEKRMQKRGEARVKQRGFESYAVNPKVTGVWQDGFAETLRILGKLRRAIQKASEMDPATLADENFWDSLDEDKGSA